MARVFITGSTDGLGLAAAVELQQGGHDVVLHARSDDRVARVRDRFERTPEILVADLEHHDEALRLAEDANALGAFDAVIHNAGLGYRLPARRATPDGHSGLLAVNVLAPYILVARMERAARLVFLSSGLHRDGVATLDDVDWIRRPWDGFQAYADSKLFDTALAFALALRWPAVRSNSVEPGWVATKMGGPGAPDDLEEGHRTQVWLAVSDDPAAAGSGRHFYHRHERATHPAAHDPAFQDELLTALQRLTGVELPADE